MMRKKVLWLSLGLLIFFILISPLFFMITGLEFKDGYHEDTYDQISFFGILISILVAILSTIQSNDSIGTAFTKIVTAFVSTFVTIYHPVKKRQF